MIFRRGDPDKSKNHAKQGVLVSWNARSIFGLPMQLTNSLIKSRFKRTTTPADNYIAPTISHQELSQLRFPFALLFDVRAALKSVETLSVRVAS
jgi:hypothetical protein